jgi:hypothetical protein
MRPWQLPGLGTCDVSEGLAAYLQRKEARPIDTP